MIKIYDKQIELIKYLFEQKRIPISYLSNKTEVPYGTIAHYSSNTNDLDNANRYNIMAINDYLLSIGVESKEDIDRIVKKTEYIVNK